MSNAKVRARRRRRGNRAWTAAMTPIELALVPLPRGATPALLAPVPQTILHVIIDDPMKRMSSSQPNVQNLKKAGVA